jgi:hypothetical protein
LPCSATSSVISGETGWYLIFLLVIGPRYFSNSIIAFFESSGKLLLSLLHWYVYPVFCDKMHKITRRLIDRASFSRKSAEGGAQQRLFRRNRPFQDS